jgi:hypothetical protein
MSIPLQIEHPHSRWTTFASPTFCSISLWLLVALFDVALQWANIHSLSFGTPTSFNLLTMDLAMAALRAQLGVFSLWLLIGTDRLPSRLALFVGGCSGLYWVFTGLFFARMFPNEPPSNNWYLFSGSLPLEYLLIQGPVMMVAFIIAAIWLRRSGSATAQPANGTAIQWYQFTIVDFLVWSAVIGVVILAGNIPPALQSRPWIWDVMNQWKPLRTHDFSTLLRILIATVTAATVLFAARAATEPTGRLWKYVPLVALGLGAVIDIISLSIRPELLHYDWTPFQQRLPEALLQPMIGSLSLLLYSVLLSLREKPAAR